MTNAEAQFNSSLRPRKPEGSLGRTAQDVHLDSHTAPELWQDKQDGLFSIYTDGREHQPHDKQNDLFSIYTDGEEH